MKKALGRSKWFKSSELLARPNDPIVNPWEPGVYETAGSNNDTCVFARRWDGRRWSSCCDTKEAAAKAACRPGTRPNYWRGLARKP